MDKGLTEFIDVLAGVFTDTLPQILGGLVEVVTLPFRLFFALLA
ncbi:MAG: hypothetical protein RLZZ303_53 [Candidatus Hydrogenedentota bacterium]|jgi:hypothetical protein